jgi:sugar lactone lactonase YvrE
MTAQGHVLADRWQGKRLNSPNDVVIKSDDSIWFTDPDYGILSDYEGDKPPRARSGAATSIASTANRHDDCRGR